MIWNPFNYLQIIHFTPKYQDHNLTRNWFNSFLYSIIFVVVYLVWILKYRKLKFTVKFVWISFRSQYGCEFESLSGKVYSIQHYVIKFVSDFLWVLWFPLPIKLTATYDIVVILLKVALSTINKPYYLSVYKPVVSK